MQFITLEMFELVVQEVPCKVTSISKHYLCGPTHFLWGLLVQKLSLLNGCGFSYLVFQVTQ